MHLPEDSARIHNQICISANVHVDNQGNTILTLEDDPAVVQCATCFLVLSNAQ